jgi:hypothetical protein
MTHDEDELFSILERAIGPTAADTPTDTERQHLRAVVDDWRQHQPIPITAARSHRWLRRGVATGLGAVVVLSGATAVAAAVNDGVLPAPARSVARTIGLPVESSDLARARAALGRLRKADESKRNEMELELEAAMNRLSASERAKIDAAAAAALLEAHGLDEQQVSGNSGPGSGSSGSGSSGSGSSGSGSSGSDSSGSSGSGGSGEASTTSTTDDEEAHGGDSTTTSTTEEESHEGESHSGTSSTSTSTTSKSGESGHGGGDDD